MNFFRNLKRTISFTIACVALSTTVVPAAVYAADTAVVADAEVYATVNCSGGLNLRADASTASSVIKVLPNGYTLTVLDVSNGWVKVSDSNGVIGFVSSEYVVLNEGSPVAVASSKADEIVAYSKQFIGTPYVPGGTSLTSGVDCSGFTYALFKHFGIQLNRVSRDQIKNGTPVSKESLMPGDLVFFHSETSNAISHVGMYIGNGQYIHSTDGKGKGVTISSLYSAYGVKTYHGACRVIN